MENNKILIAGQWYGFYSYGPEYGRNLAGKKVIFSFLIETSFNNQFKGKCIELEGWGASTEVSRIEGFLENNFISFSKEYATYYTIDEFGKEVKNRNQANKLFYKGDYDQDSNTFSGTWEIWSSEISFGDGAYVDISTGTWEISQNPEKYGL